MGFVLYDIVEEHRHLGGHLLQIDGLFVRPPPRFRPHPPRVRTLMLWHRRLDRHPAHRWLHDVILSVTKSL